MIQLVYSSLAKGFDFFFSSVETRLRNEVVPVVWTDFPRR
jgi:hypothetical protein